MSRQFNPRDLITENLATAPAVFHHLQTALADPNTTFEDYAEIIQADTSLAARLLKIANSPFFGFESKVQSITHAMSVIGLEQIIDLALASLVMDKFQGIPKELVLVDAFWRHSIATGICARLIARHLEKHNAELAYLMGLLHDLGSLILYRQIPVQSRLIISEAEADGRHLFDLEREILGFNHSEMGALLLMEWGLPPVFYETIAHIHQPSRAGENREIATIIHLADCAAYFMGLGTSGEPGQPEVEPGSLNAIGLSNEDFAGIQDKTLGQYSYTVEMYLI